MTGTTGTTGTAPVVQPADAVELAARLKDANDAGLAVVPCGGGTKLSWGNRPRRVDLLLSTSRLDRILEHPWADLTVTVEAGCRIGALQEALAVHGQRVAIDPLWPDRATVGGVVSTGDTAALRLRFGGLRDLIIGTTLALADGTLARSGGKVVKNVAGYDLSKLVTGAYGTLGVITSATFRLHPLPRQARTLSAAVSGAGAAQRLVSALQDSQLAQTALQVRADATGAVSVDVLFEGTPAGIDAQSREAVRLAGGALAEHAPAVWSARQDLWTGDDPRGIAKVSVLPAEIGTTLDAIARRAGDAAWCAVAQATGIGWVRVSGGDWAAFVRDLRGDVAARGGSVMVLEGPVADMTDDVWGEPGDAQALMSAVKHEFDPRGTLNPGRFAGRL